MCQDTNEENDRSTDKPQELKPDAVSSDGVLEFLSATPSPEAQRPRAMSSGSKDLIEAQMRQLKFRAGATELSRYLDAIIQMLQTTIGVNRDAGLEVPSNLGILQLDMRLGSSTFVSDSSPPPPSIIESRLQQVGRHALKLQARIDDTVSRVLVTGDLNAGKSSLCNALLRRAVLPVDQQPCTNVFCEVVDCSKNDGIEEVHAVPITVSKYSVLEPETYEKFSVDQLKSLVHESDKYKLLVVYIRDPRPKSQNLLANGVVDLCVIDAPGLNVSAVTTTELFGRQEEIDLVIFVVSAENHFTQSANEFVSDTAKEKSLLFIAVNSFDKITDKDRCRDRVLNQVAKLSPETHKVASDFVHFVTSNGSNPNGDDPNDGDNNENDRDDGLNHLESSLRNFILNKRSETKLAPARTFLLNVLNDLEVLADHNLKLANHEREQLSQQLNSLVPSIDEHVKEYAQISEQIERDTEKLSHHVLVESEKFLTNVVSEIGEDTEVEWAGLAGIFDYIRKTREVLVSRVLTAVTDCEDQARELTASAVDSIKQLGVIHSGGGDVSSNMASKMFNKAAMFSRKRDNLSRHITADFGVLDVFDVTAILERPLPVLNSSKQALVSAAAANATLGSALGGATAVSLYQTLISAPGNGFLALRKATSFIGTRQIIVPAVLLTLAALGAYVIYELPRTIPKRLARKIAFEIDELGYVRSNAERISSECRKVLRYPAQDVRSSFQSQLESRTREREEYERSLLQAEHIMEVFSKLANDTHKIKRKVTAISI